ncbi:MAG: hypothetical protein QM726_18310 [Chitinophagaceae bacterium]
MLKLISLITTFAFISTCYSQYQYIGMHRFFVKKIWKSYAKKDKLNMLETNSDSTVTFSIRDTMVRDMDFIAYFNQKGKCNKVEEIFDCDSCFRLKFNKVLSDTRLRWTKVAEDAYLSEYSKKLLLFKNPKHGFAYIIQYNKYMTREQYNSFLPKETANTKNLSQN